MQPRRLGRDLPYRHRLGGNKWDSLVETKIRDANSKILAILELTSKRLYNFSKKQVMKMKDDLVIKEIRKTRELFCQEFRFDVKKIATALKEREQMHPEGIRTPQEFPIKKIAV